MHAPDGFYSVGLCLAVDGLCLGVITYSIKKVWGKLNRKSIALAASVAALVFALEMANFPVSKGSSCHFMGGVFASIVLGPYMATIVVSLMHFVQFFIFQDGGLLSLGPNLLTIVIISTFSGYYLYRAFKSFGIEPYGTYVGSFISAWLTLLITAFTVCFMLYISGINSLSETIGPMVGPHVLVGIMEGLITVGLLIVMEKIYPNFLSLSLEKKQINSTQLNKKKNRTLTCFLLALAIVVGILISPFASRKPDGLEKLAIDKEFAETHEVVYYNAPLADYATPKITNEYISGGIAGLIGVLITFGLCWSSLIFLIPKKKKIEHKVKFEEALFP